MHRPIFCQFTVLDSFVLYCFHCTAPVLISRPPEAIAAYVFVQYFFIFWLVGLCRKVAGTVVHLGDLVLRVRKMTQAPVCG